MKKRISITGIMTALLLAAAVSAQGRIEIEPQLVFRSFGGEQVKSAKNDFSAGASVAYGFSWGDRIFSFGPEIHFLTVSNESADIRVWRGGILAGLTFSPLFSGTGAPRPVIRIHAGSGQGKFEKSGVPNQSETLFYAGFSAGFSHEVTSWLSLKMLYGITADQFKSGMVYESHFALALGFNL